MTPVADDSTAPMARKRPAPSDGGKDARKASLACLTCRKKKVRCSGTTPCQYCTKRGLDCRVPEHGHKRMYMAK
ncbi:hypothetical protein BFJ72_g1789 [Fusarium proliferatum]|uniref:Zn(2)-C6 fungal-type domain-containing protein n=1 Tax=Gibberella intermedia TaxID=948311 RepID=A0A420U1C3_GIBIN|nr:hypothetical protein BFJ72_g1789 [Fusarium proliferatum]